MKSKLSTIAVPAACLLLGLAVGRMLPSGKVGEISSDLAVRDDSLKALEARPQIRGRSRPGHSLSPPRAERDRDGAIPAGTDGDWVAVPPSILVELSTAAGERTLRQDLFSGDGKIEEILGVTDHEKANIQRAWRESQEEVRSLEASSMSSVEEEDGTVTIKVPDLSDRMRKIGEQFGKEVLQSMGEGRGDAFLAVKQVNRMFSPEAGGRTYQVRAESTGDGGWRFHMTLEGPDGRRVWVGDTIPDEISHLTDVARIKRSLAQ